MIRAVRMLSPAPLQARVRGFLRTAPVLAALLTTLPGLVAPARAQTPAPATPTEPVLTRTAVELRQQPSASAPSLGTLAAQTPLTRGSQRSGPWIPVTTADGRTGWVHLFDVSTAPRAGSAGSGSSATGALRGLSSLFGRSATPATPAVATATVGIRGLTAEDIQNAQPDLVALRQAESLRVTPEQAQSFAGRAGLGARSVESLATPAATPAPAAAPSQAPATGNLPMLGDR